MAFDLTALRLTDAQLNERAARAGAADRPAAKMRLDEQLRAFEVANGMETAAMRQKVAAGDLPESDSICAWLMVDNRRRRL